MRRSDFAESTLPVFFALVGFALVNYLSLMYFCAITVVDVELLWYMTRARFILTSGLVLEAFLLLNLRFKPTESKELRVVLCSLGMLVVAVWYLVVLRQVRTPDLY